MIDSKDEYVYDIIEIFDIGYGPASGNRVRLYRHLGNAKKYIKRLNDSYSELDYELKPWKIVSESEDLIKFESKSFAYHILIERRRLYA